MDRKLTRIGFLRPSVAVLAAACLASGAGAREAAPSTPGFGGPDAVENTIDYDIESWDDWQQHLKDRYRLTLSADYTAVLLTANDTLDSSTAGGGTTGCGGGRS